MNHFNLDKFYEGDTFTVNSDQSLDFFKASVNKLYEDKKYITFSYVFADKVMKIPWTNASVKTLWRCVQLNMYEVDSTKDLTSDKVSVIYDVLNELFVEHYGLHIPFPSVEMKGV